MQMNTVRVLLYASALALGALMLMTVIWLARDLTWLNLALIAGVCWLGFELIVQMFRSPDDVPTIATGFFERQRIAKIVSDDMASRGMTEPLIIDLGSGGGDLARALARAMPQAKIEGYERSDCPLWRAKLYQKFFGPKNISYIKQDFTTADLSRAHSVVMFLNGKVADQVGPFIWHAVQPGTLVVSHEFALGGPWQPPIVHRVRPILSSYLYVYRR